MRKAKSPFLLKAASYWSLESTAGLDGCQFHGGCITVPSVGVTLFLLWFRVEKNFVCASTPQPNLIFEKRLTFSPSTSASFIFNNTGPGSWWKPSWPWLLIISQLLARHQRMKLLFVVFGSVRCRDWYHKTNSVVSIQTCFLRVQDLLMGWLVVFQKPQRMCQWLKALPLQDRGITLLCFKLTLLHWD